MDTIKRCIFTVFVAACLTSGCGSEPPERAAPVWTGKLVDSPHVFPLGDKYIFRVPKGTSIGKTSYGAISFHVVVGQDTLYWFGRWDIDFPTVGAMNLHTLVEPIADRYDSGSRRPVSELSVITTENVLVFFHGGRLYLRLLWLKDARGDYAELSCGGSMDLFDNLASERTVDVLSSTNCRFRFKPREDVMVMMQLVSGERIREFIERANDIYIFINESIEDVP